MLQCMRVPPRGGGHGVVRRDIHERTSLVRCCRPGPAHAGLFSAMVYECPLHPAQAGRMSRPQLLMNPTELTYARTGQKPAISSHDAAKESNLPSRWLPGPASFEERPESRTRLDLQGFSAGDSS